MKSDSRLESLPVKPESGIRDWRVLPRPSRIRFNYRGLLSGKRPEQFCSLDCLVLGDVVQGSRFPLLSKTTPPRLETGQIACSIRKRGSGHLLTARTRAFLFVRGVTRWEETIVVTNSLTTSD